MKYLTQFAISLLVLSNIAVKAQNFNTYYNDVVNNVSATNILTNLTTFENFGIKEIATTAQTNTKNWIKTKYRSLGYTDIVEQPFNYSGGACKYNSYKNRNCLPRYIFNY